MPSRLPGLRTGTVVGNTSPQEYRFFLKSYAAKLGDLVYVEMDVPAPSGDERVTRPTRKVAVWGRIVELGRFNPFLPTEAGVELAEEGLQLRDTVLSISRDQVDGRVLVLGMTKIDDFSSMEPLNYPVSPGADVILPPPASVKEILIGGDDSPRLNLGWLIGRPNVDVKIKTNAVIARHMAILAMTGGGKTVASRRVIRELLEQGYPLLILDPHGDYLGLYTKRKLFPGRDIRVLYPHLVVNEDNRDFVGYLVSRMTQGFSDAQKEAYSQAAEAVHLQGDVEFGRFIDLIIQQLDLMAARGAGGRGAGRARAGAGAPAPGGARIHPGTIPAVKRGLRIVSNYVAAMDISNQQLRNRPSLRDFPFAPMPDPVTDPAGFIRPNQATILYLGGYDHLMQSSIVAMVLKHLFQHRASMSNRIPPFLTVIEEAHNFIPSRGEGQSETPSVEIIRKVITEGRKFGTGLLLVSQRPSRLDETALAQCNTFLVFRLVNPRDQAFVEKVMENLSKDDSRLLPGFGPGQGIISGQAVRFPLIIQVRHDSDLETAVIGDENFLQAAKDWETSASAEASEAADRMIADLDSDS